MSANERVREYEKTSEGLVRIRERELEGSRQSEILQERAKESLEYGMQALRQDG